VRESLGFAQRKVPSFRPDCAKPIAKLLLQMGDSVIELDSVVRIGDGRQAREYRIFALDASSDEQVRRLGQMAACCAFSPLTR